MMKPRLVDTNVLIALAWPNHLHTEKRWRGFFERQAVSDFRTHPITQTGFNSAFTADAVKPAEALATADARYRISGDTVSGQKRSHPIIK